LLIAPLQTVDSFPVQTNESAKSSVELVS
jgi:hypothetical protein